MASLFNGLNGVEVLFVQQYRIATAARLTFKVFGICLDFADEYVCVISPLGRDEHGHQDARNRGMNPRAENGKPHTYA